VGVSLLSGRSLDRITGPGGPAGGIDPWPEQPAATPRRRRPRGLWVTGLVLVAVGGLATATVVARAGDRVEVLAVAREIPVGQTIAAADLTVARIAADPALRPIPATDRPAIVGHVAAVDLRPGSLLTAASVTDVAVPGPGEQLIGVPTGPGQRPARGLRPGDRVRLVSAPTASGASGAAPAVASDALAEAGQAGVTARVVEIGPADADGKSTVDVVVPDAVGPSVAAVASTGQIVLILVPAQR
jgi:hypothetical protein